MGNKRSNVKKPKQKTNKAGQKGGAASFDIGGPQPVRKKKKK